MSEIAVNQGPIPTGAQVQPIHVQPIPLQLEVAVPEVSDEESYLENSGTWTMFGPLMEC
jgi:hypothetical protein